MTQGLPGVGGTLFPGRYLRDRVVLDAGVSLDNRDVERCRRQLIAWWRRVENTCGPATGLRALFDLVCMPLFGALGYRARDASWRDGRVDARLHAAGGARLSLTLLPWSVRVPHIWRDLVAAGRETAAEWGFVVAPPYVSLVRLRGVASRRAVDFRLPDVLGPRSFVSFWTIARAAAFDETSRGRLSELLAAGARFQDRVREDLQQGVEAALADIGRALQTLERTPVFDQSLTIVYRVLFLLFAEARHLVPCDHPVYRKGYSVTTLVRDALEDRHPHGAWEALAAITRLSREGCRIDDLVVHPFNGRLFAKRAAPSLEARPPRHRRNADELCDRAMRRALVALGSRPGPGGREEIAYADLGVEQLGAVYERVLDLPAPLPANGVGPGRSRRASKAGRRQIRSCHSRRRKETGTFYTPQPLAELVVRRTLAPLVEDQSPEAILALRVLDPAMGSGAFLVAACRYIASAYERALIAAGDASDDDLDDREQARIRRLVAERCLAGVDLNPVAVQVARLSLWLATLADGAPLTFLDHRLRVGNSLIGARPDDLGRCGRTRPAARPQPLFDLLTLDHSIRQAVRPLIGLVDRPADTLAEARAKERTWEWLGASTSPLAPWRIASDVWCARWCGAPDVSRWSNQEVAALIAAVLRHDTTLPEEIVARRLADVAALSTTHRFFHWPLEFSDVFYDAAGFPRERAGFDAVIGNPPWEMVRQDDGRDDGAPAHGALAAFVRHSGIYTLSGRGHLNLYQPFIERALLLCREGGRLGLVLPWGALVDDGAAPMRRELIERGLLDAIVGFDNARGLFPIHRGMRFAVVLGARSGTPAGIRARFGIRTAEEIETLLDDTREGRAAWPIRFNPVSVRKIGGETCRIPDARCPDHVALVERWIDSLPRLGSAAGWGARFGRELNVSDDRGSFVSAGLPVIEGKHLEPFRVHASAARHHIRKDDARRLIRDTRFMQPRVGYRDVSSVTNVRSLIAAVIPAGVVTTHTIYCLRTPVREEQSDFLCGVLNSFVVNLIVRLLMGGHVTTSLVEQLPVPRWNGTRRHRRIARLARRLARGRTSERIWSRLEAEVAAMYGVHTAAFGSIVETFPLVPKTLRDQALDALGQIGG